MQQLTIGAFSRLTHLSVKTLRYYHEVGLLEPAVVDADSGYRYYRPGQAHSAQLVRRFRDLGLPVADVKAVLAATDLDGPRRDPGRPPRPDARAAAADRGRGRLAAPDARRRPGGHRHRRAAPRGQDPRSPPPRTWRERMSPPGSGTPWPACAPRPPRPGLSRPGRRAASTTMSCSPRTAGTRGSTCPSGTPRRSTAPARAGSFPPGGSPSHCTAARTATSTAPTRRSAPTRARTAATAPARFGSGTLTDPLDTPDSAQWRTEVCWPLAPADAPEVS